MGGDCIPPNVIKQCAVALLDPVYHIFTQCMHQSYLPIEWRSHNITPIPKTNDKSSVKNYRPISLLCCLSKVLEKLIFNKIYDFTAQNVISLDQFGFMRNRSTLKQLLMYTEFLQSSLDQNCQVDTIYLDISKAFDSVPHDKLLKKLWTAGFTGNLWSFFRGYLSNHRQRVITNGKTSEWLPVSSGVPQGSILGPLLFIVYITDLSRIPASSQVLPYADDTKCCRSITSPNDCSLLQEDLKLIFNWSHHSGLSFNPSKSHIIHFSRATVIPHNYQMNGTQLEVKDRCRDLGVIYTSNLSWTEHYIAMTRKAYQLMGLIRRTFSQSVPSSVKKLLYLSLIRSQLTYCSPVWRPRFSKDIMLLERVQRKCTKYILDDYHSDYKTRLTSLHLLPLMYTYELFDILFLIRSLQNPDPSFPVMDYVSFSTTSTRSGHHLKLNYQSSRTNVLRHSYFHRVVHLWNALPPIDLSLSLSTIKHQVKHYLWSHFSQNFHSNSPCTFHLVCPCNKCAKSYHPLNYCK